MSADVAKSVDLAKPEISVTLDVEAMRAAVRQWLKDSAGYICPSVHFRTDHRGALVGGTASYDVLPTDLVLAIERYVARETGLKPLSVKWLHSETNSTMIVGCKVTVKQLQIQPADPDESYASIDRSQAIIGAKLCPRCLRAHPPDWDGEGCECETSKDQPLEGQECQAEHDR